MEIEDETASGIVVPVLQVQMYSPSAVHRGSTLVLVLVENSRRVLVEKKG
jgi:hypothetical protein